jgi:hypothetical protein
VAGRAFAFADPGIIKLATESFVAVTADDWYQRRRKDAEGEFFRKVADQGPRKGVGGSTRQGIYTLTADGELLEFKNAGQDVKATREQLDRALKKWAALPAARRKPGGIVVPAHGKLDPHYSRTPPTGGAIVRVYSRILDASGDGYIRGTCDAALGTKAARDFLWLTAAEMQALGKIHSKSDADAPLPAAIARRIARFHLVDNTRGEPHFWKSGEVKSNTITLTRSTTVAGKTSYTVSGTVQLATTNNDRGYDATIIGEIAFGDDGSLKSLDIVAVGDHWGDDSVTNSGSRPGRTPFGVAFSLGEAKNPGDRVSPQAARDWGLYIGEHND